MDEFSETLASLDLPGFRRGLLLDKGGVAPLWMSGAKRRLLQASPGVLGFKPDVTVAADGSGDFRTINEALAKVPRKSAATYVMYMKASTYREYVSVPRNVMNLVVIGDGATRTVVTTGSKRRSRPAVAPTTYRMG